MSGMRAAFLIAVALVAVALSGCLELTDNPETSRSPIRRSATPVSTAPAEEGNMTGQDSEGQASAAVCSNGVNVPPQTLYCATKVIDVTGTATDMKELPVDLSTFTGALTVSTKEGEAWAIRATLTAQGDSQQSAISNLDNIAFTWSHQDKGGHHLVAKAEKVDQRIQNREAAALDVVLPSTITYFLTGDNGAGDVDVKDLLGSQVVLDTGSGEIHASKIKATWLFTDSGSGDTTLTAIDAKEIHADTGSGMLNIQGTADQVTADTGSGGVVADLKAADVVLDAGSGGISLKLVPSDDGSVVLETGSGTIDLTVPEDATHGYSIDASTGSGSLTIGLKDGRTTGEDDSKHFVTNNFSKRSIQTQVSASTGSGSLSIEPA